MARKREGIYRRGDSPYWWASISDGHGRTAQRSTRVRVADDPDGRQALEVRAGWIAGEHIVRTGAGATFDDLILLYLEQVSPTKRDPERDTHSAKALYPVFTGRRLDTIGAPEVRSYIAERLKAVTPGTVNKEVGLMSAALNWARKELEWDVVNPWQSRRQTEPHGRARWLTKDEAARLLDAADASPQAFWLGDFVRLGLYAGLRPGEILGLQWDRVAFDNGAIRFEPEDQKNGKRAIVPCNAIAREALLRRRQWRAEHCTGSPLVIATRKGERVKSIKRGFASAVARAGLSNVHPHDLRRTCGSWLVQAGVGIERVSALLRHSDVSVTARVYAHLRPSDLAETVAVLDESLREVVTLDDERKKKPGEPG